jgi:dipeptidyl aminopeptidase/acylaminoacyl peptidase
MTTMLDVARVSVDDVADAARWAASSGLADPQRIAVYGASYGGYIALGCATRYPDLFACALGFAGVYDWEMHFHRILDEEGSYFDWDKERRADAQEHPEKFRAYSPARFAGAVRCRSGWPMVQPTAPWRPNKPGRWRRR